MRKTYNDICLFCIKDFIYDLSSTTKKIIVFLYFACASFFIITATMSQPISPLHLAVRSCNEQDVAKLLKQGFSVHEKDLDGFIPLHWAAALGLESISKLLIQYGANVNAKAKKSITPLHNAAKSGNLAVVELLLSKGAQINTQDDRKMTPQHYAALGGCVEIIKLLAKRGASFHVKADNDLTLLHCAAMEGCNNVIEFIIINGFNINVQDTNGLSPLHWAVLKGHEKTVQLLLDKHANANIQTKDKQTPLHYAVINKNEVLIKLLSKHCNQLTEDAMGRIAADYLDDFEHWFLKESITKMRNAGRPIVMANEYKTNYACRRVAIFLNGKDEDSNAIVFKLMQAFQQKACPIIVSQLLFYTYLYSDNDHATINEFRKKFILNNWSVYGNKRTLPIYYLLCPRFPGAASLLPSQLGFREAINTNEHRDFSIKPLEISDDDLDEFFNTVKKNHFFKSKHEDNSNAPWNIFLNGHGAPGGYIAGMTIKPFRSFLTFLSTEINTHFLYYSTCYGGGKSCIIPYLGLDQINFIIAENSTTELSVNATREGRFNPSANFVQFFSYLEQIYKQKEDPTNSWKKISSDPWQAVLLSVAKPNRECPYSQTPLIRFPEEGIFHAKALDGQVFILTEENKNSVIQLDNNKKALLVYPDKIPAFIVISPNLEKIVSMIPLDTLHVFARIKTEYNDPEKLFNLFDLGEKFYGNKIFFIHSWNEILEDIFIELNGLYNNNTFTGYFTTKQPIVLNGILFNCDYYGYFNANRTTKTLEVCKIAKEHYLNSVRNLLEELEKRCALQQPALLLQTRRLERMLFKHCA